MHAGGVSGREREVTAVVNRVLVHTPGDVVVVMAYSGEIRGYRATAEGGLVEVDAGTNILVAAAAGPGTVPPGPVHLVADGDGVTLCCGRTPFELPRTERVTSDAKEATCLSAA